MIKISNAIITNAELSMRDHGIFTLYLTIEGDGFGVVLGGRVLGRRFIGANNFKGSPKGIEERR